MDRWEQLERMERQAPMMPLHEWRSKYPNGGPEYFSGSINSDKYLEYLSAIKRRDKEAGRGEVSRFWWLVVVLCVAFVALWITEGIPMALFGVCVLSVLYCFIVMGLNLPPRR